MSTINRDDRDDEIETDDDEKTCHHGTVLTENCGECLNDRMLEIYGRD